MVLAVEKPSFLVYQLLEPYFRQLFRVVKVSKLYRETFLIFIFSSKSGRNYPVVRYLDSKKNMKQLTAHMSVLTALAQKHYRIKILRGWLRKTYVNFISF